MTAEGRRCAVLGSPIAHSLSPALHTAAYAALGLPGWHYGRHEVGEGGLRAFVDGLGPEWRGLSLTMPLKAEALALGEVEPVAALAGVANTLVLDGDARQVHNTDVPGLVWAVREAVPGPLPVVTVLGSGATARSAVLAASSLGTARVQVVARNPERAQPLVALGARVGVEVVALPWTASPPPADLLVSTVTRGVVDASADALVATAPVVFDVVYDPWPTALAAAAGRAGARVLNGLDLLVGQALLQLELMTGRRPEAAVLRDAGRAELAARA